MTGALDLVAWPALVEDLAAGADEQAATRAAWYAGRPSAFLRAEHMRLAVLAEHAGADRLTALLTRHGDLNGQAPRVGEWLYWTGRIVTRLHGDEPPPLRVPAGDGPVHVDPRLPGLPLLGLALRWAQADPGRQLVIRSAPDLLPRHAGRCSYRRPVTLVQRSGLREITATVVELADPAAMPHELAHVVDPHGPERPASEQEQYADHLGGLLDRHRPADLDELAPLLDQAEAHVSDLRQRIAAPTPHGPAAAPSAGGGDLPAPGFDSVLAFALLPLQDQVAAS